MRRKKLAAAPVLRAVLDTNISLRMLMARPGTLAGKLRGRLENAQFTLIFSPATARELIRTLNSPSVKSHHGRDEAEIEAFVRSLLTFSIVTPGALQITVPELLNRDPDDVAILPAAIEGGASFVVTQDKDLLSLATWEGVRIIELPGFFRLLQILWDE